MPSARTRVKIRFDLPKTGTAPAAVSAALEPDLDVVLAAGRRGDVARQAGADGSARRQAGAAEMRQRRRHEQVVGHHARDRVAGQAEDGFAVAHRQDGRLARLQRHAVDQHARAARDWR